MVGPDGLEPSTLRLSSACSNQLSYEPMVGKNGDPSIGGLRRNLWSRPDSNRRPPACKAGALPTELRPRSWSAVTAKNIDSQNLLCAINWNPDRGIQHLKSEILGPRVLRPSAPRPCGRVAVSLERR